MLRRPDLAPALPEPGSPEPTPHGPPEADPTVDEASPRYFGWRVVLACFVMAVFCWGFGFYGHGVYLAELRRLHGWPASLISTASTVYYLFGAVLVVFISDAIGRLGPRRFVLAGAACLGVSAALIGAVAAPWQLYAVYLLMAFGWAAMSGGAISTIVSLWFDARRGLAISLALNGASVGGMIFAPALIGLIGVAGFAAAMPIAAAVMAIVLLPIVVAYVRLPSPARHCGSGATHAPAAKPTWTRARALHSVAFWSVSASFALALLAQVGFLVHVIALLEPNIGRTGAGIAVSLASVMAVAGRLGLGVILDRINPRVAACLSLISQAAALLAITQSSDALTLYVACAVFGLSVGNVITLPSQIIHREFETASFGLLIGLNTAICQFTYAFGPGLVGLVRDAFGSYVPALALCMGLELAAAAIVVAHRPAGGSARLS
jgi:MFS family permease